jgi:hypothetical protein
MNPILEPGGVKIIGGEPAAGRKRQRSGDSRPQRMDFGRCLFDAC